MMWIEWIREDRSYQRGGKRERRDIISKREGSNHMKREKGGGREREREREREGERGREREREGEKERKRKREKESRERWMEMDDHVRYSR
jgi:hypothetical protein